MEHLTIISANVRGLQTNLGDLTHSFVLPLIPDIIATVETFLNSSIPDNYGKISGYTNWHRNAEVGASLSVSKTQYMPSH